MNNIDLINTFIKIFSLNLVAFYSYFKITNIKENKLKEILVSFITILIITCLYINLKVQGFNQIFLLIGMYLIQLVVLNNIFRMNNIVSSIAILMSNAISYFLLLVSFSIGLISKFILNIQSDIINMCIIFILEIIFVILLFKIKRFRNGFSFLKKNNDFLELAIINISSTIIFIYSVSAIYDSDKLTKNFFITIAILGIIMFIIIQKTLILFYKQKQLERTVKDYEDEIKEKDKIIEKKTEENFRYNKLNHEFYGRLKSLEITVEDLLKENKFSSEIGEELAIDINNLTKEYSNKQKDSKSLDKLPKTEILEIDNMLHYMQTEADKKNIDFNLQITGNIYYMINNIIPKNLLVTLIGDHLKDAMIAVDSSNNNYKNILVILGINDDIYELCIYDSGIEFEIDTLLNLGLKPVTTHSKTGGTGIGFITTFETLNKTKASLIIEEKHNITDKDYTKAVRIRFDNKNEYKIISYRAEEIRKKIKDNRIIIENL